MELEHQTGTEDKSSHAAWSSHAKPQSHHEHWAGQSQDPPAEGPSMAHSNLHAHTWLPVPHPSSAARAQPELTLPNPSTKPTGFIFSIQKARCSFSFKIESARGEAVSW